MNKSVFGKTEKCKKHKLVSTEARRSYLVSQPNCHTTIWFSDLQAIEMNKTKVTINKPVYLGLSILDINKIAMYDYWYDCAKAKYGDSAKLCRTDMDSFIAHIKSKEVCADLAGDVKARFDTSNYEVERPLSIRQNKSDLTNEK